MFMGPVVSWPPELGFSGLLTTGPSPGGQSSRGAGTESAFLGPCTARVREVARSQTMSVMGEGRPAFHALRSSPTPPLPRNQSPGVGDAEKSLSLPSPPDTHLLVLGPVKNTMGG